GARRGRREDRVVHDARATRLFERDAGVEARIAREQRAIAGEDEFVAHDTAVVPHGCPSHAWIVGVAPPGVGTAARGFAETETHAARAIADLVALDQRISAPGPEVHR